MRFSASSQIAISAKSVFGQFQVIFLNVNYCSRASWQIPVITFKEKNIKEKMSSLAGFKKFIQFPAKVLVLPIFDYLGPPSKSIFSTYRQNSKKSLVFFLWEVVGNIILNFELSIFSGLRGR